jgi:hypothetical protein
MVLGALALAVGVAAPIAAFAACQTTSDCSGDSVCYENECLSTMFGTEDYRTLADIAGRSQRTTIRRIKGDERLVRLAAIALAARDSRKTNGTAMMILGFGTLVGGSVVGELVWASGTDSGKKQEQEAGLAIMLLSVAVGLPLGIAGIVSAAKSSDEENRFYDYFDRTSPESRRGPSMPATAVTMPVFGYRF